MAVVVWFGPVVAIMCTGSAEPRERPLTAGIDTASWYINPPGLTFAMRFEIALRAGRLPALALRREPAGSQVASPMALAVCSTASCWVQAFISEGLRFQGLAASVVVPRARLGTDRGFPYPHSTHT